MGAWGHSYFENDSALDWLSETEEPIGLRRAFARAIAENEYLQVDEGAAAVAAAAIVARACGVEIELPEHAEQLAARLEVNDELKTEAVLAVRAVLGSNSELRQLAEGTAEWHASVELLLKGLGQAP